MGLGFGMLIASGERTVRDWAGEDAAEMALGVDALAVSVAVTVRALNVPAVPPAEVA
jgi:hypothetical protein